jgi:hypothetical protein
MPPPRLYALAGTNTNALFRCSLAPCAAGYGRDRAARYAARGQVLELVTARAEKEELKYVFVDTPGQV